MNLIWCVGILILLLGLAFGAFSQATKRQIGLRDGWECVECGRSFAGGWMVHACHYDHCKTNDDYDDPDNGRILCIGCHIKEHQQGFDDAKQSEDRALMNFHAQAVRKLKKLDQHTYAWHRGKGR